jgi:hypothetical protein
MKKISEMQNYIVNFAQENMQADSSKIENTIKKYLLRLKTNVAELNRKYSNTFKSALTKNTKHAGLIFRNLTVSAMVPQRKSRAR